MKSKLGLLKNMNVYIKSISVNLFSGIFNSVINFNNGLNIISGVNGTGKTELLKLLKTNNIVLSDPQKNSSNVSIYPISPKRNTEKQSTDSILQAVKTQDKTIQKFIEQIKSLNIKDSGFENYPSFGELFIQEYDSLMQDGSTGYDKAIELTAHKFNEVLAQVFPDYKIEASWLIATGNTNAKLDLKIKKYNSQPITHDQLSTGEREVLALLFSIFVTRDKEDIYLIDEPEIHLNWDLEKGLFDFFDWFCEKFEKQIIVVTHSRVIFKEKFYKKSQFLVWENGKIVNSLQIKDEQKVSIAGEVAEIVGTVQFDETTFFVEDKQHKLFVEELANILGKKVQVIVCNGKSNVVSMYELLKSSDKDNVYFLIDGDNQGSNILDDRFIVLRKYCIENYLLDIPILAKTVKSAEEDLRIKIVECINEMSSNHHNLVFKKLAEVANPFPFEVLDTLSGDIISSKLCSKYNLEAKQLVRDYIKIVQSENKLDIIFGEITIKLKT